MPAGFRQIGTVTRITGKLTGYVTITITGCIVNGAGGLAGQNGYVLKATGVYTLVIDPNGNTTGEAVLKLHS